MALTLEPATTSSKSLQKLCADRKKGDEEEFLGEH